jgi:hypothetical protein
MTTFRATHQGSSDFSVTLLDTDHEQAELLVSETGNFEGTAGRVLVTDSYVLDIKADGAWSVIVEQPRPTTAPPVPKTFTGRGMTVAGPFAGSGQARLAFHHDGEDNFMVSLCADDAYCTLVANEIGMFDGSSVGDLASDIYWLAIRADGNWTVSITA